ncbi:MAG TPA: DUF1820 family protein [Gammaproteobacteria bacterium]|nr:DUF1820 family protein [Gammaproteobacteria bacterium]
MAEKHLYKIAFFNQGKVYEIYARNVSQEHLYGFVAVEGLVFGEQSGVVVDPTEERLKSEFDGVERVHIPMHAIIRIDEVARRGTSRITTVEGENVMRFPGNPYNSGRDSGKR